MGWLKKNTEQPSHLARGEQAENEALRFLRKQGLKLVEKNFYCKQGEIDLIMLDDEVLVFAEVRYRSNPHFGDGADSVDYRKQRKLINAANVYLQNNPTKLPCRFDVVSVSKNNNNRWHCRWIKDAFQEQFI